MKVLVTGAGGHLGFNLVQALLAAGHDIRASLRSLDDSAAVARLEALGPVQVVAAPLESEAALRAAFAPEEKRRKGISEAVVRLSVGLEESSDLCDDLAQALAKC